MTTPAVKGYRQIKRIKDEKFDIDDIQNYSLSVLVGIRDLQLCVTDPDNKLCYLEDLKLEGIKTINSRVRVLKEVFDNHHFLKAGFWKNIKLGLKTHKFTLIPEPQFDEKSKSDYIAINNEVKPSIEEVYFHKHQESEAVNVFVGDIRLIKWIRSVYVSKPVDIIHQGTAFIEGVLRYDDHSPDRSMFSLVDRGILHIVVTEKQKLLYYNQFAVRKSEDILKYTMLVFKELQLKQKTTKVIVWGSIKQNSPHIDLMKKYIRDVSYGSRPQFLKCSFQFDEIPEHQYFDLFNIHLC